MRYFDALTNSSFRISPKGDRLFFPWGVFGRGYVIGSEPDFEKLRRQIKIYLAVSMALIIGVIPLLGHLAGFFAVAVMLAAYVAWIQYLLRDLQMSDERQPLRERFTAQARTQDPMILWFGEIASLAFVAVAIFILVTNPANWIVAIVSIAFFGAGSVIFIFMLVLRRRH